MPHNPQKFEKARHRGIYLFPNLLTTAGLFAGFYAIVAAMKGLYDTAAIAVFVAMIADTLDGRVARLMHASTAFGLQYDSLSDMVSFGLAPALVLYSWALKDLGKLGWLIAFLFAACVALRLARFNVQTENGDKRYFIGLPCPSAAAATASMVWCFHHYFNHSLYWTASIALFTLMLSLFMVSNIFYRSFREVDFRGKTSFINLLIIVLIFIAISLNPPLMLFSIFTLFSFSGPCLALMRYARKKKAPSLF